MIWIIVDHILPSFFVLAFPPRSLMFWQLILGCRKNVGEPLKYPSLSWNIQWDRMLLYPVGSLSQCICI